MRIFAFVTLIGLTAGTLSTAHAQSLADVAQKEQERRQTVQTGKGKVYTNGDLPGVPQSAGVDTLTPAVPNDISVQDGKADQTADKPEAKDAKADEKTAAKTDKDSKGDVKDRDYWNARMQALNQQLERDRLYAEALQTRVNALTADFSARDDPAQRALIAEDREKAVTELERLKRTIAEDKDAIYALEEEARKAGVPPGWLR